MKTLTDDNFNRHLIAVPITLHCTNDQMEALKMEKQIALTCSALSDSEVYAIIENPVFFENRKEEIAARVLGTLSTIHPKMERIMAQGDYLVSGKSMRCVRKVKFHDGLDQYRLTPREIND
jgi:3'-phosphoadenosine 5'-phosphosulfate synthase